MATSKAYFEFIREQLSKLDEVSFRAMMGEYIVYFRDKIAGGLYDDRFLIKPTEAAKSFMENVEYDIPYEGAKPMLVVDNVDNRDYLKQLFKAMYDELPAPKPKKAKKK